MQPLTKSEKIDLGTTEIAKRIRQQLKKEFPNYKFSVTSKYYSMGSSITISLMESPKNIIRAFQDIPEIAFIHLEQHRYNKEQIKEMQNTKYHQLNPTVLRQKYNPEHWCNGVFLTEEGHKVLKRVVEIADYYNYDDSDPMIDYFSTNFHLDIDLGKYDKPYKVVE